MAQPGPPRAQEGLELSSRVWVPGASHHPNLCGSTGTALPCPQLNAHQHRDLRTPGRASGSGRSLEKHPGVKQFWGTRRIQALDVEAGFWSFQSKFGSEATSWLGLCPATRWEREGLPCRKQIAGAVPRGRVTAPAAGQGSGLGAPCSSLPAPARPWQCFLGTVLSRWDAEQRGKGDRQIPPAGQGDAGCSRDPAVGGRTLHNTSFCRSSYPGCQERDGGRSEGSAWMQLSPRGFTPSSATAAKTC